ncbi:A-kinase anchor protein 17A [Spea bombifrons]|uniref:A-kinase anchor protein 17A n=1 Tax=Spea bombifrons TaxID=233779 RepID=UPI002349F10D|nr:A-kinase anchor protein 17A [Spea bombifrons]XP_053313332.1 A-kinase anchor protein 17A [Spea bombifrons]
MAAATIVHDASEAAELCQSFGLYLKPITKMIISVALPQLKQPGKSISNWEVMERLKGMVTNHQFSTLRISKSTIDFIRFEGEVDNKSLVKSFVTALDGKSIKLSGFSDILKVRAAEYKIDFPTRHDWDSFFRDAKDMNENSPGERPDTIHLEGLPCKWFASMDSGLEKPSEEVLVKVFSVFGEIRNVDIPMLDPYREEMTGRNFHTFSFGGHLNFEAYVQYKEYAGFVKAMTALRGMKLMHRGEDGKAVACNIKVSFDTTKHLSEASIKKRQLERQKLQELELRREEQKRKEKEAEERQKEEERKQKEQEDLEKEKKKKEKMRRKEEKLKERELRRNKKKMQKLQAEEQKRLQEKIRLEERRLLLAQRNLQSIRLIAELLSRVKSRKLHEEEEKEAERILQLQFEDRRRQQEAELRRVEEEKQRALSLQRKERELREKLLNSLIKRNFHPIPQSVEDSTPMQYYFPAPSESVPCESPLNYVTSTSTQTPSNYEPARQYNPYASSNLQSINEVRYNVSQMQECKQIHSALHGMPPCDSNTPLSSAIGQKLYANTLDASQKKNDVEESRLEVSSTHSHAQEKVHKHKSKHKRDLNRERDEHKFKKTHKKHNCRDYSPHRRSLSPEESRNRSKERRHKHSHRHSKHYRRPYSRDRSSWSS